MDPSVLLLSVLRGVLFFTGYHANGLRAIRMLRANIMKGRLVWVRGRLWEGEGCSGGREGGDDGHVRGKCGGARERSSHGRGGLLILEFGRSI